MESNYESLMSLQQQWWQQQNNSAGPSWFKGLFGEIGAMPATYQWLGKICSRCDGKFYVNPLQNVPMGGEIDPQLCPWCKGLCSASEQEYRNLAIEAELGN